MSESKSLKQMVTEINNLLASYGKEAVQQTKMEKEGKIIGKIKYGFKPQYVFDAINEVIGPENWRYEAQKHELFDSQAVIETKLFIRINGEWLLKGSQFGQMQIIKGNIGDALKGAVTDSLQKAFSLISVGKDAYGGKLETLWAAEFAKQKSPSTSPQCQSTSQEPRPPQKQRPTPASQPPAQNSTPPTPPATGQQQPPATTGMQADPSVQHLPQIAGVDYVIQEDRYIAKGDKLFDKKDSLKAAGFRWDGTGKSWFKEIESRQEAQ